MTHALPRTSFKINNIIITPKINLFQSQARKCNIVCKVVSFFSVCMKTLYMWGLYFHLHGHIYMYLERRDVSTIYVYTLICK